MTGPPELLARLRDVEQRLTIRTPDPLPGQLDIDLPPPPAPVQLELPEPP